MKKCIICKIVTLIGGIGALNWGLMAYFDLNIVSSLLGDGTIGAKIAYTLVGLAGLMLILCVFKSCPKCKE